jgi:hypothetical protein
MKVWRSMRNLLILDFKTLKEYPSIARVKGVYRSRSKSYHYCKKMTHGNSGLAALKL